MPRRESSDGRHTFFPLESQSQKGYREYSNRIADDLLKPLNAGLSVDSLRRISVHTKNFFCDRNDKTI